MKQPTEGDHAAVKRLLGDELVRQEVDLGDGRWATVMGPPGSVLTKQMVLDAMKRMEDRPIDSQYVQLETYLRQMEAGLRSVSGLNDLLTGTAPAAVTNSSKAINALVSRYEK